MSQQINLFNPVFLKQRKYFSLPAMLQALGLVVIGSLAFYGYAFHQVGQLEESSAASAKRYEAEQARLTRYTAEFSPQKANMALQQEADRLELELAGQVALVEMLRSGAMGNTTGYSGYMRAFARQVVPGLWLTGFRVTGDATRISLNGGVTQPELLPAYIQRLGKEEVMQGKPFAALQMQQAKVNPADQSATAPHYVAFTMQSAPESEAGK